MQNQIKVLNNTLEKAQERNGSARQDLKKEIAGIRNWSRLWKMLAKFTSNPQIMQVKRSYLEYSQLNSASALKIVYDKGMVENHCGKDKRQILRESEIYSRENQNHNNSFICDHYGNQDISKVKVPPKQQKPKVHPRKQNRRN